MKQPGNEAFLWRRQVLTKQFKSFTHSRSKIGCVSEQSKARFSSTEIKNHYPIQKGQETEISERALEIKGQIHQNFKEKNQDSSKLL